MPSEEDFLEIIRAHPNDDLPRQVYADWLDEQGDPRAELIRLLGEVKPNEEQYGLWNPFVDSIRRCFGSSEINSLLKYLDEREQRLFACECAELVLPLFEKIYPKEKRLRNGLDVARAFANGRATPKERRNAYNHAWALPAGAARFASKACSYVNHINAYEAARNAADLGWSAGGNAVHRQYLVWLVERLLKFKID